MGARMAAITDLVGASLPAAYGAATVLPFFDVTLGTLGMAVAGSLVAFAYGTPVDGRARLFGYAAGGIFIGLWCAQILPHVLGWGWYEAPMQAPVAGFSAFFSRWWIPLVVEQGPTLIRRLLGHGEVKK